MNVFESELVPFQEIKTCKQRVSMGWTHGSLSTASHHWLGWTRPCQPTWVAKISEWVFHQRVVPTWVSIYTFFTLTTYNHPSSIAAMDYTCWCALGRQGAPICIQHLGPSSYTNNLVNLDHHRLQGHCKGSNIECADRTLSGMWFHLTGLTSKRKENLLWVFWNFIPQILLDSFELGASNPSLTNRGDSYIVKLRPGVFSS